MTTNNSCNTYIVAPTTHQVTWPAQPAFFAYVSSSQLNVTGDGTNYTCAFDTERYDQNADYNTGTYTFTAPVDGIYLFATCILMDGIVSTGGTFKFDGPTDRSQKRCMQVLSAIKSDTNAVEYRAHSCASLDAADTLYAELDNNGGAKTEDLIGGANRYSQFSGTLIC